MRKIILTYLLLQCCASANAQEIVTGDSLAVADNAISADADGKDALIKELQAKNNVVAELYGKVSALEKEVEKLEAAKESVNSENEKNKLKIETLEAEKAGLKKQMNESALKKQVKSLDKEVKSLKQQVAEKSAKNHALEKELAEKEEYIARFDAFRVEFERETLIGLKPLLERPFSQIELSELEDLYRRVEPFAVDSVRTGFNGKDGGENFSEFLSNVEYAINNKNRYLLCDSLLARPFDAAVTNLLKDEMDIERDFITAEQYAEFEVKFKLLDDYALMAVELARMVDDVNNDSGIGYYRSDSCDASPEQRKKRVMEGLDAFRLDASRFDGLVFLSELYTRYLDAFENDFLKKSGVLEAVEQEIKSVAEQARTE